MSGSKHAWLAGRSIFGRWVLLALASVWVAVGVVVVLNHHTSEEILVVGGSGRTYFWDSPAPSLYQQDPGWFKITTVVGSAILLAALVELIVRTARPTTVPGYAAFVVGALFGLFAFLSLVVPLLVSGVVGGILVALSGVPMKAKPRPCRYGSDDGS